MTTVMMALNDEVHESVVSVGVENAMRSQQDQLELGLSELMQLWNFQRIMTGRLVLKQTYSQMESVMQDPEWQESMGGALQEGSLNSDFFAIQNRQLKHTLTIHPQHSKFFSSLVTDKSDLVDQKIVRQIKSYAKKICEANVKVGGSISVDLPLFIKRIDKNKEYLAFYEETSAETANLGAIQERRKVDNEERNGRIKKELDDALFLAQIISRLLPYVELKTPELIEVANVTNLSLLEIPKIQNRFN